MNKRLLWIVIIFSMLALALQACEFSVSTASISSAKLTSDSAGTTETKVMEQSGGGVGRHVLRGLSATPAWVQRAGRQNA